MATQTLTEKDMFVKTWQREFATTVKVLKAYPAGKEDFKPADKSRSGRELAFVFVVEEKILEGAIHGVVDFSAAPAVPQVPVSQIIGMYESSHAAIVAKVEAMTPEAYSRLIKFPVGPGLFADMRAADILWSVLSDAVHHRGQLSVYLRILGAKVPSIYGPTADETWM